MSEARDRLPGWCRKHQDFMWRYEDGSESCRWELVVERRSGECDFSVDGLLAVLVEAGVLERGAVRDYGGGLAQFQSWDHGTLYRRTEANR